MEISLPPNSEPSTTFALMADGTFKKWSDLQPGDSIVEFEGRIVTAADFGFHVSNREQFQGLKRR
jgi:hypothetical protein